MNCNQIFIDQLRCPTLSTNKQHVSLKCPPKYSQSFIMNQLIHKPRILRNLYSVQKYSSSIDGLCQSCEQPQVLNKTISQLSGLKTLHKPKKTSLCSKSRSNEKNPLLCHQYHERKRSNTYHINSLAKTALLFVNRQDRRIKVNIKNSDNHFDIKNLELLHMTQFSGKQNPLNTTITLPNQKYESTLISCLSQTNINLTNQINLVKEYVPEINQYNVKLEESQKITKNIPKILLEKYATSDDSSLYLESSRFKIERNFNQIYKSGKFRWLYPGEEAAIIEGIESFLNECSKRYLC